MPEAPKKVEAKLKTVEEAWETHAKNAVIAEMTLEQFKAAIKPSRDARANITALESQVKAAITDRETADKASLATVNAVVLAVAGDTKLGPDSKLYEAMGYVRKSERKSGLTRKKKKPDDKPK